MKSGAKLSEQQMRDLRSIMDGNERAVSPENAKKLIGLGLVEAINDHWDNEWLTVTSHGYLCYNCEKYI